MCTALNFRKGVEISFLLATDGEIKKFHKKFLGEKSTTDVITFAEAQTVDVAISLDQALRQAGPRGVTLPQETTLLMLHGLLHAKGFDDRTERAALAMRAEEFQILARVL